MEQRDSFVFRRSYNDAISRLNKRDRSAMLTAIVDYTLNGIEPELSGIPAAMFSLMKPSLDDVDHIKKRGAPLGNQNAKNKGETITNQLTNK